MGKGALLGTDTLETALVELARRAGEAILAFYRQPGLEVAVKADASPLTQADLAAHRLLKEGLEALIPACPVLSEESKAIPVAERLRWGRYWLVDPLDGTKEFLRHNDEFTVNIALIEDHRPQLGLVHAPALGTTYVGGLDLGARRYTLGGASLAIAVQSPALTPIRVVGSRSHPSPGLADYVNGLGPHTFTAIGSSLKFCLVAEGQADVYPRFGPTSEWDTAAAQAVLEGAGGAVVDLQGQALRYNRSESLLNPYFIALGDKGRSWLPPA
jgi:3'(2'), 5'-bisphosphate nucleotidase